MRQIPYFRPFPPHIEHTGGLVQDPRGGREHCKEVMFRNPTAPPVAPISFHAGLSGVDASASRNDALDLKGLGFMPEED